MGGALSYVLRPFATPLEAARHYTPRTFRQDVMAGLTVAVVALPQSMAYALIAGVPPVYGIYTAIMQSFLAAFLTSSNHLSTGPINTLSLLVASAVARVSGDPGHYIPAVIAMTFLVGAIQLAFAAARMAVLVQYVSHSVIVGFTSGAGILIAAGQIPAFLGIKTETTRNLPGVLGIIERMLPHLSELKWQAVAVGGGALAVVIASRLISRFVPGPLLAAVGGALVVWSLGWTGGDVKIVGPLPQGLPHFKIPDLTWANAEALFGGALALALVGMLEAFSIAKSIAAHTGQRINPNQEFWAQGVSNFVSSFFQCIPGSGSFSRSALNYQAGAQTCWAGVYNSLFVAGIFLVFAKGAEYIPLASLAAILFVIAYGLIDWRFILRVRHSNRADAAVCLATLVATLLIPLEFAIMVGIFLNIGLYLRTASRLHLAEMVQMPGGRFLERSIRDRSGRKTVMFLQLEGDLFFGVADELQDRLSDLSKSGVRIIIFRLKRTHSIDATVLDVLERFTKEIKKKGGHVLLCGVKPDLMEVIRKFGLLGLLGDENVFEATVGIFSSAKLALARARHLAGESIDTEGVAQETDEPETWAYQI